MTQHSQLRRFGVLDTSVPQYASYPPASHFSNTISAVDHGNWLMQIPVGSEVSVYVHVPFCKRLCWFCSARTQGATVRASVSAYVDALIQEAATLRAALPAGVRAKRVYWGGGTPTILSPDDIKRLAEALNEAVPLADTPEITVEIDPNDIDDARIDALAEMGMTRAMIGVQDFDPAIQQIIGRALSFEATKATVDSLRSRGIQRLSLELLYGLPKQQRAGLALLTQLLLSLSPGTVSVQPYSHSPTIARRQSLIPTSDLPTPDGQQYLFETAAEVLRSDGYDPIGIDHFARPADRLATAQKRGDLRRCFQGYTNYTGGVLLGLGASAVSRLPHGYVQNAPATTAYLKAAMAGRFATTRGHPLTKDDALRGRMVEMILCDFQINTGRLLADGLGTVAQIETLLAHIMRQFPDLVVRSGTDLRVPAHAKALTRVIARSLDAYAV